ncbi:MAG: hypothetical protein GX591_17360 [Planctomycetes bacterium]|nr:hypothetical protein [Planctomycetota bacterium]
MTRSTRTGSTRQGRTGLRLAAALAALAAAAATAAAQTASTAPADGIEAAVAVAENVLQRLDHLRICAGPRADAIGAALDEGLAALRQAGAQLPATGPADRTPHCRLDLMRGSLHLAAAEAAEADDPRRQGYLDKAMETCKAVRIDYTMLTMSQLSSIQQANIHRLAGDYAAAYAVLEPLMENAAAARTASLLDLRRLAAVTRLDVTVAADPIKAIAEAESLQRNVLFSREEAWKARVDWRLARACAAASLQRRGAGDSAGAAALGDRAAALLRSEGVRSAAPAYDRLSALASLETGAPAVLTDAERLAWADVLAAGNHAEAVEVYRRAEASMGGGFPPQARLALATALLRQGRFGEAADACDALLADRTAPADLAGRALQVRAGALLRAAQASPEDVAGAARLAAALLAVSDGADVPAEVRTDALRQWVTLTRRHHGEASCTATLERRPALVAGDPYLSYALALGRWQAARQQDGGPADADVARVEQLAAAAEQLARRAGAGDLAARAALLRAVALAARGAAGTHAALAVLNDARPLLASCEATASASAWLRLRLLLDAGLIDQAAAGLPEASAADEPDVILRIAGLLADRAAPSDPAARGRIVALCNRALERLAGDGAAYRRAARQGAGILLKAGAHVDASAILERLLADPAVTADGATHLACSLMRVDALRQGGAINEADALLDRLNAAWPDSPEAHLARADMKLALNLPEEAAAACRKARLAAPEGSVPWCSATLQLARALRASGHHGAAADLLRVSGALHPAFGNTELKAEWRRLIEADR